MRSTATTPSKLRSSPSAVIAASTTAEPTSVPSCPVRPGAREEVIGRRYPTNRDTLCPVLQGVGRQGLRNRSGVTAVLSRMYSTASVGSRTENRVRERVAASAARRARGCRSSRGTRAGSSRSRPLRSDRRTQFPAPIGPRRSPRSPSRLRARSRRVPALRSHGSATHSRRAGSLVPRARVGRLSFLPKLGRGSSLRPTARRPNGRSPEPARQRDFVFDGAVEMRPLRAASASDA